MESRPSWIRTDEALRELVDREAASSIAIDLEADSYHHYTEQVCLVQLSVGEANYLIDPLAGVDLGGLRPWLDDRAVRKVFHGADYDLRLLKRDHGLSVEGLFDTMIAARLTGHRSFGLAAMLLTFFDVRLDKSLQRADWSVRPLSPAMESYAVEDTRHLDGLAERLTEMLRERGRLAWAEEEFQRLERVKWAPDESPERAYLRVKGARSLDGRGLAVLASLYVWRDAEARRRDRPPTRVLRDAALVEIARARPASPDELRKIGDVPRRWTRGREATGLVQAVAEGLAAPPREPVPPDARRPPVGVDEARLRRMRRCRDRIAAKLDLDPSLVGSRRVLEAVAVLADKGEDWTTCPDLRAWQRELLDPCVREIWGAPAGL